MRVVLALERAPGSAAALDPAMRLAQGLDAPLVVLFAQDPALLASAALPVARQLDMALGLPRPLSAASMEQALAREARRAEDALTAAARGAAVALTFRVVRDRLESAARAEAAPDDLMLLGLFGQPIREEPPGLPRAGRGGRGAVAAYCAPDLLPGQVLRTAARLCQATGHALALGAPPGLGGEAKRLARAHAVQAGALWLPDAEPPAFLRAAARHGARLCVMASGHARHAGLALRIRAGLHDTLLALAD